MVLFMPVPFALSWLVILLWVGVLTMLIDSMIEAHKASKTQPPRPPRGPMT